MIQKFWTWCLVAYARSFPIFPFSRVFQPLRSFFSQTWKNSSWIINIFNYYFFKKIDTCDIIGIFNPPNSTQFLFNTYPYIYSATDFFEQHHLPKTSKNVSDNWNAWGQTFMSSIRDYHTNKANFTILLLFLPFWLSCR